MSHHFLFRSALAIVLTPTLSLAASCVPWCRDPVEPPPISTPPVPARLEATVFGKPLRLHALPSGTVAVKQCHRENCLAESANYGERFYAIMADCAFAEPLPIWSYVIEHPEGRFAVDTGETPAFSDSGSWACDNRSGMVSRAILRIDVAPADTLPARLNALGLPPVSFRAIVLTHAHADHVGGVPAFFGVPVWSSRADIEAGMNYGIVPCRTLAQNPIRYVDDAIAIAPASPDPADALLGPSLTLTKDQSLRVWVTAGHTPGSLTLRLSTDQGDLWMIGDLSFTAAELGGKLAGIHADFGTVRRVQAVIAQLASTRPSLILPAHDPTVPARIAAFAK